MSSIITVKVSGAKDAGCITPEELVRFCIDNDVDRINSCGCLWSMTNRITGETMKATNPFDQENFPRTEWDSEQLNEWEFDVN